MKRMDVKLSRRELALAVTTAAALAGQTQPQPALAPTDELAAARQQLADNAAVLAKFDFPQATEPAVHFRA